MRFTLQWWHYLLPLGALIIMLLCQLKSAAIKPPTPPAPDYQPRPAVDDDIADPTLHWLVKVGSYHVPRAKIESRIVRSLPAVTPTKSLAWDADWTDYHNN
jgi:hypothetical protein